ncbi:uncharacterized protein LOC143182973 [Calliopsis andreniformis]|uniref:uncharacterized protein LOC143182973 n=1 Tax=Calliopsis andreniformis TaxID=337506 RepID=UPI003FCD79F9
MSNCISCNIRKGTKGLSFHKLPKDEKKARLWLRNIGKENYDFSPHTIVCSKHFAPECFSKNFKSVVLKPGSVPNICTEVSQASIVQTPLSDENIIIKHETETTPITETSSEFYDSYSEIDMPEINAVGETNIQESRTTFGLILQHDHQYILTPESTDKKLQRLKKRVREMSHSNRILKQKVKRLQITVTSLKEVIHSMSRNGQNSNQMTCRLKRRKDLFLS